MVCLLCQTRIHYKRAKRQLTIHILAEVGGEMAGTVLLNTEAKYILIVTNDSGQLFLYYLPLPYLSIFTFFTTLTAN